MVWLKTKLKGENKMEIKFTEVGLEDIKTDNKINYKDLADMLIDDYIDTYGIMATIEHLYNYGLTEEQLKELKFDENDIKKYFDNK